MAFFRKARVRRRVRKALKKYVRKNAAKRWGTYRVYAYLGGSWKYLGPESATGKRHAIKQFSGGYPRGTKFKAEKASESKYERVNPARVKGRKVKGGRAVTVRNFTGTIVKKADGTVQIVGKGRRK